MFRAVWPPIIRSIHNCTYSIWYLSDCYCYLPLLWKSRNSWIYISTHPYVFIVVLCLMKHRENCPIHPPIS